MFTISPVVRHETGNFITDHAVGVRGLLFMLCLLVPSGFACGPDFPNSLLADGDKAALQVPQAYFRKELERMRLVTTTNVARVAEDPREDTLEADLTDLREALQLAGTPTAQLESCIAQYRIERANARSGAHTSGVDQTHSTPANRPRVPAGLPREFADYFRGAIAWHQTNTAVARAEWMRLLSRPPPERRFKSTWAAFMLGRGWESTDPRKAAQWYRRVRELAQAGFVDSLGLAVASLGWEARLKWHEQDYSGAIQLYLEQDAAGDPSAEVSLRFVAADALRHGRRVLDRLARNQQAERVITAYVISGGYRQPDVDIDDPVKETGMLVWSKAAGTWSRIPPPKAAWHTLRGPAKLWLESVEAARVRDVESAEQLALAAYQAGEMELTARWLNRARPTAATMWLRAKLCLRDGKVEEAEQLLAKVNRAVPVSPSATKSAELTDSLYVETGAEYSEQPVAAVPEAVRGELALAGMARRDYLRSLDLLMHSAPFYWMDAAFIAERVLTLEQLKTYVDREFPSVAQAPNMPGEVASMPYSGPQAIRYLLARRLARAYRFAEARSYYPAEWLPSFDQLSLAWAQAEDKTRNAFDRADALIEAAAVTRKYGLELIGTELEPDWRLHAGNYEQGLSLGERAGLLGKNYLGPSSDELNRAVAHGVRPEKRWHYRTVASVMGWEAAKLMRDAPGSGRSSDERAELLFAAANRLVDYDIMCVPLFFGTNHSGQATAVAGGADTLAARVTASLTLGIDEDSASGSRVGSRRATPSDLWNLGFTCAALAWEAAKLMPDNSEKTARVLCEGGQWISGDPPVADVLYKSLVRRCRKTSIGAEADRIRWFPRLDEQGHVVRRKPAI